MIMVKNVNHNVNNICCNLPNKLQKLLQKNLNIPSLLYRFLQLVIKVQDILLKISDIF